MIKTKDSILNNFKNHLIEDNLKNLSVKNWKEIFSKELSNIFNTKTYGFNPVFVYRSRINLDKENNQIEFFNNTKDLWAIPAKKAKNQGRCNLAGQSLLYCSSVPMTTIFELKPKTGESITILEYKTNGEIGPLGIIGINEILNISEDYKKIFINHFKNNSEESVLLDDILSNIFKTKSDNTINFPIYNLTNAITQIFLNKQPNNKSIKKLSAPSSIGLIYPSVESKKILGVNLVLKPNSIKLEPCKAYKYKIIKCHDEHHFDLILTHQTNKIYSNGQMTWTKKDDSQIEFLTDL